MSSKAAKLGAAASFQQAQPISARRAAINAATKAPTEGTPPPVELPVEAISLNPANPRSELGDLTDLAGSLKDHGQKTAISIMSRFTYLEANPGREDELEPGTKYVAIDGNSRLAAAREAGLTTIKVMLDDDLGSNPDEVLESALVANIHRQNLDHLDEARALKQLLAVHGTQEALAARLHRSQGWVSQRLALLGLTPELKAKLESGEESADLLRLVGKKKPEEQAEHLQRLKDKRAQEKAAKQAQAKARKKTQTGTRTSSTTATSGDSQAPADPQEAAEESTGEDYYDVIVRDQSSGDAADSASGAAVPDPRSASVEASPSAPIGSRGMTWTDGPKAMDRMLTYLVATELTPAIGHYLQQIGGPDAFASQLAECTSAEYRKQLAELLLQQ